MRISDHGSTNQISTVATFQGLTPDRSRHTSDRGVFLSLNSAKPFMLRNLLQIRVLGSRQVTKYIPDTFGSCLYITNMHVDLFLLSRFHRIDHQSMRRVGQSLSPLPNFFRGQFQDAWHPLFAGDFAIVEPDP